MTLGDQDDATLRMGLSVPEPIDRYTSELMCYGGSVSRVSVLKE